MEDRQHAFDTRKTKTTDSWKEKVGVAKGHGQTTTAEPF